MKYPSFGKRIHRALQGKKLLSLDIFDTVLWRAFAKPTDVFRMVETIGIRQGRPWRGLAQDRILAESKSREFHWQRSQIWEVNFHEIFEQLGELNPQWRADADLIQQIELQVEEHCIRGNSWFLEIFNKVLCSGLPVAFVSDMYLPKEFIEKLLHREGFIGYHTLLVSSEERTSKAQGGLFKKLLSTFHLEPGEVLHIGDNRDADYSIPRQLGIDSFLIPKSMEMIINDPRFARIKSIQTSGIDGSVQVALFAKRTHLNQLGNYSDPDFWNNLGYTIAGPIFLGFTQWLVEQIKSLQLPILYFLSRDGLILESVYKKVCEHVSDLPPSRYLYCSRRAVNFASIEKIDIPALQFLHSGTSRMSVAKFLSRIGLNPEAHTAEIKASGFRQLSHIVDTPDEYHRLHVLLQKLEPEIIQQAQEERNDYLFYLASEEVLQQKQLGLVDIGWQCSMQQSLANLIHKTNPANHIFGYYLGTFGNSQQREQPTSRIFGWACQHGQPVAHYATIREGIEIIEFLFTNTDNSLIRMTRAGGRISPVFDQFHVENDIGEMIEELQRGALQFVDDALPIMLGLGVSITPETIIASLRGLIQQPTKEELLNLGRIPHAEGFGGVYVTRRIAQPRPFPTYLICPWLLQPDFKKAFWQIGFYERLNTVEQKIFQTVSPNNYRKLSLRRNLLDG